MKLLTTGINIILSLNLVYGSWIDDENGAVKIDQVEESFIDSIYGDLVQTSESYEYKLKLYNEGKLKVYKEEEYKENDLEFMLNQLLESQEYSTFSEYLESSSSVNYAINSHNAFRKYKSKANYPDDDDTSDLLTIDKFGGILTFGHFKYFNCFNPKSNSKKIDIAIVGAPFDTGVSFRPGARFGPEAIRQASRRGFGRTPVRGNGKPNSKLSKVDPYNTSLSIIDCGNIPMTPYDNRIALNQLYRGERAIHNHEPTISANGSPKIITMGGDHTITLMALKSAYEKYGKVSVLHFDSHIDTWNPKILGGGITNYMSLNHGTFLHYAAENGYLNTSSCMHLGLRAPYISAEYDIKHDHECGFETITARDFDNVGRDEIIERVKERVGNSPVYISVDIDVLDPSNAPGTGTMEVGGWTTRELLSVIDGLEGINLIGADVVEVSPPFDTNSEITSLAATAVIDSFLGLMIVQDL
ncbi:guanidinobutyrase [[Candida] anglica]|uniref:Guanidinobutyrase n=1 Tax=[Candida] anglica TaxID=148631 RepID=A0ABP0EBH6_9ASCO